MVAGGLRRGPGPRRGGFAACARRSFVRWTARESASAQHHRPAEPEIVLKALAIGTEYGTILAVESG